jgi:hypothetical protein
VKNSADRSLLSLFGMIKADQPEILLSHPEIYPEVEIVRRSCVRLPYVSRFGLHYQIPQDRIVITLTPGVKWQVTNEQLIEEQAKSLKQVCAIITQSRAGMVGCSDRHRQ